MAKSRTKLLSQILGTQTTTPRQKEEAEQLEAEPLPRVLRGTVSTDTDTFSDCRSHATEDAESDDERLAAIMKGDTLGSDEVSNSLSFGPRISVSCVPRSMSGRMGSKSILSPHTGRATLGPPTPDFVGRSVKRMAECFEPMELEEDVLLACVPRVVMKVAADRPFSASRAWRYEAFVEEKSLKQRPCTAHPPRESPSTWAFMTPRASSRPTSAHVEPAGPAPRPPRPKSAFASLQRRPVSAVSRERPPVAPFCEPQTRCMAMAVHAPRTPSTGRPQSASSRCSGLYVQGSG